MTHRVSSLSFLKYAYISIYLSYFSIVRYRKTSYHHASELDVYIFPVFFLFEQAHHCETQPRFALYHMTLRNKTTWKLTRACRCSLTSNESQEDPRAKDVSEPKPRTMDFRLCRQRAGGRLSLPLPAQMRGGCEVRRGLRDAERRRATPSDAVGRTRTDGHAPVTQLPRR